MGKGKQGVKAVHEICECYGDNLYSEVIVYSKELKIAGTIDLIAHNNDNGKVYIFDWKTTGNLYRDNRWYGITYITKQIRDTTINQYTLQLTAYNYLLDKSHDISINEQFSPLFKLDMLHTAVANVNTN